MPSREKGGGFFMVERVNVLNYQETENKQATIYDHYDISNEAKFLRKAEGLSLAEKQFYIRENILGFLGEYVGKIPYKRISYILKDGRLTYAGLNAMDSYWKTANLAGQGSREWYETLGMDAVQQALESGYNGMKVNQAAIISPPKNANYGLVFNFSDQGFDSVLQGNLIHEYILRYDETKGEVENSRKIASGLSFEELGDRFTTAEDFLQSPILSFSRDSSAELERILRIMGFDEHSLEDSLQFEQAILQDTRISAWTDKYFKGITELSGLEKGSAEYSLVKGELEVLLAGIYNRAKDIKAGAKLKEHFPSTASKIAIVDPIFENPWEELDYYAHKRPVSISGGSCPTAKKANLLGYISIEDIRSGLEQGLSIQDIFESKSDKVFSENKQIKCPECGWEPNSQQLQAMEEGRLTCCPGQHPDGKPCKWDPCTKTRH